VGRVRGAQPGGEGGEGEEVGQPGGEGKSLEEGVAELVGVAGAAAEEAAQPLDEQAEEEGGAEEVDRGVAADGLELGEDDPEVDDVELDEEGRELQEREERRGRASGGVVAARRAAVCERRALPGVASLSLRLYRLGVGLGRLLLAVRGGGGESGDQQRACLL
jgi:hypothetical protein